MQRCGDRSALARFAREMRIPLPANARSGNHGVSGLKVSLAAQL
jgi:hypothetical protein